MRTEVSILMPAYNAERYLAEAVESVLSQTHDSFELLIMDDGSTDDTRAIAESYAQQDGRVRVISQSNMGVANTLNRGLELASNEWVLFMHADDVMMPERVERQIAFVEENPDLVVGSSFVHYIDENGEKIGKYRSPFTTKARVREAVDRCEVVAFHHPAAILRKTVIQAAGGLRQEFWPSEDIDLWNRLAERNHTILVQPEYLLEYRKHESAASTSRVRLTWQKCDWVEACMRNRRSGMPEPTWEEFLVAQRRAPLLKRANKERVILGKVLYTTAVAHFSRRRYPLFAPTLLVAALVDPAYVARQLATKLDVDTLRRPAAGGA